MMKGTYFSVRGEKKSEAAEGYNQELSINTIKTVVHNLRIQEKAVSIKR